MMAIYNDLVTEMDEQDWRDSGILPYSEDRTKKPDHYPVGRMSDRVVVEGIKQRAPFNLVDGAWLNNILTVGPSNVVQSNLFSIWSDEAGNGKDSQNHANVYDALLKSVNIYLPSIDSSEFVTSDFLPRAFTQAVFELSVGRFPKEYFPELLGMTLYLEWPATPTLRSPERLLAGRKINPLFYQLHVAIDNITAGHGFLAKEAIKLYLAEIRQDGGESAVQAHWQRIWNGYVRKELIERYLILDKKSINLSNDPTTKKCWPDIKGYYRNRMIELVKRKAAVAAPVHSHRSVNGHNLGQLFSNPGLLLDSLEAAGYVNLEYPRDSKFLSLLEFDGPMYKIFAENEKEIILDWIESLRPHAITCVDPIKPGPHDGDAGQKMARLIASRAAEAKGAHHGINLRDSSGQVVPLLQLFDRPLELMSALVNCGWVVPGEPSRSMLFSRIATNGGPMDGVFSAAQLEIVSDWIANGAKIPESEKVMAAAEIGPPKLAEVFHLIGAGAVH